MEVGIEDVSISINEGGVIVASTGIGVEETKMMPEANVTVHSTQWKC
jgi:hypothetical protein